MYVRVVPDTNVGGVGAPLWRTPATSPRTTPSAVITPDHGPAILGELEAVLVENLWLGERSGFSSANRVRGDRRGDDTLWVRRVCRDPDDDQILAIAVIGTVDALVTGDADLLALGAHGGVNISSIADFEVLARG